jgi:molybdate transport system regulatory protein
LKLARFNQSDDGRIVDIAGGEEYLDNAQLRQLEQSFREWAEDSKRENVRLSRLSVLLIFLLIRYTGAKLNEVLSLNFDKDIDWTHHAVVYRADGNEATGPREVHISQSLIAEIRYKIDILKSSKGSEKILDLDPGFVRRKFYERAQACGCPKKLGGPEAIRKARGIELMQSNIPLPAVQMILGHSTPNLTSSYVAFSKDEIQAVAKRFVELESGRKTSARNSFFGKVKNIVKGDIQSQVEMSSLEGHLIITVITNDSLKRLGLSPGRLVTAEVKAPLIILHGGDLSPECSAENRVNGVVTKITKGEVNTEYIVKISETTEICAVVSSIRNSPFELKIGDSAWALFNCSAVVLHID